MFLLLVMASVVAGVVEEAGFRGCMQGSIELRHGPVVAILLNGYVAAFVLLATGAVWAYSALAAAARDSSMMPPDKRMQANGAWQALAVDERGGSDFDPFARGESAGWRA